MLSIKLFFFVVIAATVVHGEKILFFLPLSSKSMANIFEPLAKALSSRGHELTLVTPLKFKINSENVTHHVWFSPEQLFSDYPDPFDIRRSNNLFSFPLEYQKKYCHKVFENKDFRKIIQNRFDLIVLSVNYHDCFAGGLHKIGAPIIFVSTLPMPHATDILGNPNPSSFLPIVILGDISERLSFFQRTKNFLFNAYFTYQLDVVARPHLEAIYRHYLGNDLSSIKEIYRNQVSLLLQNSHYAITNPRPNLPSVVEIGGIHCEDAKPLPKDLDDFVSRAKDGFILFSMGSIIKAKSMPESVRLAFLKTFANLKQRVVWRWELEGGMPDAPENVKIVKWLPQQDLLGHPNIRLFITHGGLLSTEEAIYHGVPVVGLPVYIDQDSNMRQAEILGFGLKAEILDLTQEKLEPLVRRVLDDSRFMEKAKNLSTIFRDQPNSVLDNAIFWTEYVLRHKGAYHLRSSGMHLNVFQYHCVDVVVFLASLVVTLLLGIYLMLKSSISFVTRCSRKTGRKNKVT